MPHNGKAILPKDIQMTPFRPKGLINIILNTKLTSGSEGVDGFQCGHPNLNGGHLNLLENIAKGILNVKVHPTSF